jgi:2-oxoglutarate dehydrogenase E2 component (dihydrolipoamide succinyltransferase)
MSLEMKVPSPGESITEVEIAQWLVEDGDYVEKDQTIAEVDSDKATLELPAEEAGIITLKAEEGDVVDVGGVVCLIDTDAERPEGLEINEAPEEEVSEATTETVPNPLPASANEKVNVKATPVAKEMITANKINPSKVAASGSNGKITKGDIEAYLTSGVDTSSSAGWGGTRDTDKKKMSMMRRNIAKRLVAVKSETAMLTTFNELDMKPVMDLRKKI